jgi:hypothetical protein
MFVPPQKRKGPRIIVLAIAIMIFALVYLLMERRSQKPPAQSPVRQLQQESAPGNLTLR